jgi:calcineurin-like phosphoesterase family protein
MIYFTSDTHFWHYNIIEFCGRPVFPDTLPGYVPGWADRNEACERMNALLIERWNSKIKPEDEVYHLGDFAFCGKNKAIDILEQLNGKKYWIRGNHDYELCKKVSVYFEWVRDYYVLRVHDKLQQDEGGWRQYHQPIVLMHFPIYSWDGMSHGTWHLHGHCHGSLGEEKGTRMDVGVDTNKELLPYSYEEIKKIMAMRSIVPVDHHKPRA